MLFDMGVLLDGVQGAMADTGLTAVLVGTVTSAALRELRVECAVIAAANGVKRSVFLEVKSKTIEGNVFDFSNSAESASARNLFVGGERARARDTKRESSRSAASLRLLVLSSFNTTESRPNNKGPAEAVFGIDDTSAAVRARGLSKKRRVVGVRCGSVSIKVKS